jgi:hypothetical protein
MVGGLTVGDFGNALSNTGYTTLVFFAGVAVAATTSGIAKTLLKPSPAYSLQDLQGFDRRRFCYLLGFTVGLGGSAYFGSHMPFVSFAGEKALKFLAISLGTAAAAGTLLGIKGAAIGLITMGGALGYFEPVVPIMALSAAGSILGSILAR